MGNLASDGFMSSLGAGRRQSHTQALVKTGSIIFNSALVGLDLTTGKLEPLIAGHSPNLICVGAYDGKKVTGDGVKEARALPGVYPLTGTGFALTDLFKAVYAIDDQTVSTSSNGGARAYVGTIEMIDSATQVRVAIDPLTAGARLAGPVQTVSGALVAGVLVINSGINVTASTVVTGIVRTLAGGTFADGGYEALTADITVGVPGTGVVKVRALKLDGTAETGNTDTVTVSLRG